MLSRIKSKTRYQIRYPVLLFKNQVLLTHKCCKTLAFQIKIGFMIIYFNWFYLLHVLLFTGCINLKFFHSRRQAC